MGWGLRILGAMSDQESLEALVGRLVGAVVERVRVPEGGAGQFGLGLRLAGTRRVCRRWLCVHALVWRVDGDGGVVVAAGDAEERLASDLAVLVGREITGASVVGPAWDTRIGFGGGLRLTVFPVYCRTPAARPEWTLRLPSRHLLVVGPGARWEVTE